MNPELNFFGINWATISGLLRNVLLALSSGLVTGGMLTGEQQGLIIGGILAAVSVVLSWVANGNKAKAQAVVEAVKVSPLVDAKLVKDEVKIVPIKST